MTSQEELQKDGYILVAPLDWGLGHAVRCVPLIRQLLADGQQVLLGGSEHSLHFLRKHYPRLPAVELPAYRVRYPFKWMWFNMLWQSGRLLRTAWREHLFLRKLQQHYPLRAVISDNRFGLFTTCLPSVYITHQCTLPLRSPFLRWVANGGHRAVMQRFTEVWVPDYPPPRQLAPQLSSLPPGLPAYHIGVLTDQQPPVLGGEKPYRAVIVLSGPEPQRTRLEELLVAQLPQVSGRFVLVRGTLYGRPLPVIEGVSVLQIAGRARLQSLAAKTDLIIARSGYTTIMDLSASGHKALLIPTPGQPEQEYLARELHRHGYGHAVAQRQLHLAVDLARAEATTGFPLHQHRSGAPLRERLMDWYTTISD